MMKLTRQDIIALSGEAIERMWSWYLFDKGSYRACLRASEIAEYITCLTGKLTKTQAVYKILLNHETHYSHIATGYLIVPIRRKIDGRWIHTFQISPNSKKYDRK